jgi:1-acyl-sn-glycerol-3-phosphate acyltransferase
LIGTRIEVRGRDKLPAGAALVASKHQSAWDTMGLVPIFKDPALIMKAELMLIPFYGWFSRKFGMIAVRRESGPAAMRQLVRDARARADVGRHIVIFPEGTRRAPRAEPDYKPGVVLLYEALKVPCVPVALNSGLFWPRRQILKLPGTIIVEILDPLPVGLARKEFRERLEATIEAATARLVAEGEAELARIGFSKTKSEH